MNAVDYLLKPVDQTRLEVAVDRTRRRIASDRPPSEPGRNVNSADLEKIVGQLVGDGLIRAVANGDAVPFAVAESRDRLPYVSPELQAYRDMEDLLALDPPAPGMKQIAWKGDASN